MVRYQHPVTPVEFAGSIADIGAELVPGGSPVYVYVRPTKDAPADECFPLVEAQVAAAGGAPAFGWTLWELPGVFVEAEFHAVWRNPMGELLDVAPKQKPVTRVFFLEDSSRVYAGRQINNVRRSVSLDAKVNEYLATFDAEFEIMNRGARADQHGQIRLEDDEARELHSIHLRRASLHFDVIGRSKAIGPYTPCWCSSGKKAKWCHGAAA